MEQVPIRELNQQTASVLARVQHGETIEITNRGKAIARIIPAAGSGELDDWVAVGKAIPATNTGPIPMPQGEVDPTADAGELIRMLRDEQRW